MSRYGPGLRDEKLASAKAIGGQIYTLQGTSPRVITRGEEKKEFRMTTQISVICLLLENVINMFI